MNKNLKFVLSIMLSLPLFLDCAQGQTTQHAVSDSLLNSKELFKGFFTLFFQPKDSLRIDGALDIDSDELSGTCTLNKDGSVDLVLRKNVSLAVIKAGNISQPASKYSQRQSFVDAESATRFLDSQFEKWGCLDTHISAAKTPEGKISKYEILIKRCGR